ncbi:very short patch repair endonuclease [Variovorax boronicumulans]|uniref:very short patch repair endonuclease n=1 Tax=Variovorax boronicumulans TaxID=436515 RepID=UPI0027D8D4E5|nr:DNA mismatch endonuclease Vsr [Variovorax boronicumulans]
MDKISPEQRSRNMAAVRGRDTGPELAVRKMLHGLGLRFRLHRPGLPGTPDIVLPRHYSVVLVHGCFWHGHTCPRGRVPSSNTAFWLSKLGRNKKRDAEQAKALRALGWRVFIVWECETKEPQRLRRRLAKWFQVEEGVDRHISVSSH